MDLNFLQFKLQVSMASKQGHQPLNGRVGNNEPQPTQHRERGAVAGNPNFLQKRVFQEDQKQQKIQEEPRSHRSLGSDESSSVYDDNQDFLERLKFADDSQQEDCGFLEEAKSQEQIYQRSKSHQRISHDNRQPHLNSEQEDNDNHSTIDNFHDHADDNQQQPNNLDNESDEDFEDDYASEGLAPNRHTSSQQKRASLRRKFIPLEFAKQHILRIEDDMKKMHDRHVKLMGEMDENYRLIEQETQEYYIEFLQKWKELAKTKIARYRMQCDELVAEKAQALKSKDSQIDALNEKVTSLVKEKEKLMREYHSEVSLRDSEMESQRVIYQEDLRAKDRERNSLRAKLEEEIRKAKQGESDQKALRESDQAAYQESLDAQRQEFEKRLNEYEDILNEKSAKDNETSNRLKKLEELLKIKEKENADLRSEIALKSQSPIAKSKAGETLSVPRPRIINPNLIKQNQLIKINQFKGASEQDQLPKMVIKRINPAHPQNNPLHDSQLPIQQSLIAQSYLSNVSHPEENISLNLPNYHTQIESKVEQEPNYDHKIIENYIKEKFNTKRENLKQEIARLFSILKPLSSSAGGKSTIQLAREHPNFPDMVQYKKLKQDEPQLERDMIEELEMAKSSQVQQRKSIMTESINMRASKSVSPRKTAMKFQAEVVKQANTSALSTETLQQKIELLQKANSDLQNKLDNLLKQPANIMSEIKAVLETHCQIDLDLYKQLLSLRQAHTEDRSIKDLQEELFKLQSLNKALELKLKQLISLYKKQTLELQASNAKSENLQLTEQQIKSIEEQAQLKVQKLYEQSLLELESQAKDGLRQRDEKISILKNEKRSLNIELQAKVREAESMRQRYEQLEEVMRKGEQLMANQVSQLSLEQQRLQAKLMSEIIHRRKLHNVIEDMKGKIRVFCRVRPIISEREGQMKQIVKITDEFTLKFKMIQEGKQLSAIGNQMTEQEFNFDACFGSFAKQEEIFEDTKMLIQSALDGFNVCIFAYGQTGSGKTYTMQGTHEAPGIVPRALEEIFSLKQRMEGNNHYKVTLECYMVQLYVDNLIDCLIQNPSLAALTSKQPKLEIREDPQTGMIHIHQTTILPITSEDEAFSVFNKGIKSRIVQSTEMNDVSSRSHLVFTIVIQTLNKETGQRTKSKISFVDLAGSERYDKQNATADRLKEGTKINKSLSALGTVIQKLSSGEKSEHIPYRDNKLTHLMKDSIGGNSKTLMFVNISPADANYQETKSSLYFGSKVKEIQNPVQKNIESEELRRLKEEVELLKKQVTAGQLTTLRTTATTQKGLLGRSLLSGTSNQ